jgi:hypothetical protein
MAHFAQLDATNTVVRVIVVSNDDAPDEAAGVAFCQALLGADTAWKQTSYSASFRGIYAGIGDVYDPARDVFETPVVEPAP